MHFKIERKEIAKIARERQRWELGGSPRQGPELEKLPDRLKPRKNSEIDTIGGRIRHDKEISERGSNYKYGQPIINQRQWRDNSKGPRKT